MSESEFSVWAFAADGRHVPVARFIDAEAAVRMAMRACDPRRVSIADIKRVIITDGGDHTCFEWIRGKGVTFPAREASDG